MADDENVRRRLREAADIIRDRAKQEASWSRRIPESLEITDEDDAVIIRANPAIAPQARAFELGIRHPLNYPNQQRRRSFARTPHRPFLEKAVDATSDRAAQKAAMVIDDWCLGHGYTRE